MEWNSTLYDNKHDFVAEYGKGLLEFVPDNMNQKILDRGYGTGTLTAQLVILLRQKMHLHNAVRSWDMNIDLNSTFQQWKHLKDNGFQI